MLKKIKKLSLIIGIITLFSGVFFAQAATPSSFLYMTWETIDNSDIYYQGKVLASKDSVIKFSIQPLIYHSGSYIDSTKLFYRWYVNGELNKEGENARFFRLRIPSYQTGDAYTIKVLVLDNNEELGSKIVNVPISEPKIVLKPENQSLRIINKTITTNNSEIKLKTETYFLNYDNKSDLKNYWFINGIEAKNNSEDELSFTVTAQSGIIKVISQIINNSNVFIKAVGGVNIQFINL